MTIVIGTSIGGAIVKDKKLHLGANLHGGDFGYMLIRGAHDVDSIWSRIASTKALIRNVSKKKNIHHENLSGEAIFKMANEGDINCKLAIEEFYYYLAKGIYNLQYMYDPEVILIGGGVSQQLELIPGIDKHLYKILNEIPLAKVKPNVQICHFQQNANLVGASYIYYLNKNIVD